MIQKLSWALRLPVIILIFACSGCTHYANDAWTGKDKAEHFVGSAVLAAAGQHTVIIRDGMKHAAAHLDYCFQSDLARPKKFMTAARVAAAGAGKILAGILQAQPLATAFII